MTGDSGALGEVAQNHVDLEEDPNQESVTILLQSSEEKTVMAAALSWNSATPILVH